jgi:hypothetical protein
LLKISKEILEIDELEPQWPRSNSDSHSGQRPQIALVENPMVKLHQASMGEKHPDYASIPLHEKTVLKG